MMLSIMSVNFIAYYFLFIKHKFYRIVNDLVNEKITVFITRYSVHI